MASVEAVPAAVPALHSRVHGCPHSRSRSRWSLFTENRCRCLAFVLQLAMATARCRHPFFAPPRPVETPLCSPPVPCLSVHLSVRLPLLPLSLPHANPLTREVGEGARRPPTRRPRSARDTTEATGSVGIPLPTAGPSVPGVLCLVSSAAPSLTLPRPQHAAVHHLEPLALRCPPHATGHHLEPSDIRTTELLVATSARGL